MARILVYAALLFLAALSSSSPVTASWFFNTPERSFINSCVQATWCPKDQYVCDNVANTCKPTAPDPMLACDNGPLCPKFNDTLFGTIPFFPFYGQDSLTLAECNSDSKTATGLVEGDPYSPVDNCNCFNFFQSWNFKADLGGKYTVDFLTAEPYWPEAGKRIFDCKIIVKQADKTSQVITVFDNLDIYGTVGKKFKHLATASATQTIENVPAGSQLRVECSTADTPTPGEKAVISGIVVKEYACLAPRPPPPTPEEPTNACPWHHSFWKKNHEVGCHVLKKMNDTGRRFELGPESIGYPESGNCHKGSHEVLKLNSWMNDKACNSRSGSGGKKQILKRSLTAAILNCEFGAVKTSKVTATIGDAHALLKKRIGAAWEPDCITQAQFDSLALSYTSVLDEYNGCKSTDLPKCQEAEYKSLCKASADKWCSQTGMCKWD